MVWPKKEQQEAGESSPLGYLVFLLLSYVLTALLLLALAFLLYRWKLGSRAVAAGVIVIYLISTFFGGFLAGKKGKSRKYLWGLMMGTAYFVVLAALSLVMGAGSGGAGFLPAFLLCAGGGMLGGMLS